MSYDRLFLMNARKHIFFESGMTFHSFFMRYRAGNSMWGKQQEDETKHTQFDKETAEFEAEERIIHDKREFGRVRASLMKHLEAKYGNEIAYRVLRRVNSRITRGYFLISK